jgi:catechol 2,3-dioxygenase-like lactoylglutathione lyase family enzyme
VPNQSAPVYGKARVPESKESSSRTSSAVHRRADRGMSDHDAMTLIRSRDHVRVARPSGDLAAAEAFWIQGVGLEVLWRTDRVAEGEHELLIVGLPEAPWHLELVHDPRALAANPPGPEDLLVIYRGEPLGPDELARATSHGGAVVPARNAYWNKYGVTIQDPDGYLLVLSHRDWS